jgi:hypothetical protein
MLMAEGFSSSIAPYLEKKDIDMLFWADDSRGEISLKLTNEALETHVIRYADLLLFSRSGQERVFATEDGRFFRTSKVIRPLSCRAEEGSCLEQVKAMDKIERYCGTDPDNLAKKEEIIITFRNDHSSRMGFLIGSRQTLLTTFLFYQLMGFSGSLYGEMSAKVENGHGNARDKVQRLWDKLGGIEVFIQKPNSGWTKIDEIKEMGPIAPDVHLVDLPRSDQEEITLKLQLTKGLWRIDWLAVAEILGVETPLRIKPEMVLRNDTIDLDAKLRLTEQKNPLITFPGDQFELKYKIPDDCDYQYFLETKGYYLEWMREEWLKDQNMKKVALAIHFPGLFMRKVAPEFKKAEPRMEKIFWESRYVKQ